MEKLIFEGVCLETKEVLQGSLIQFSDGTCTIMFKENEAGNGFTSPVDPTTLRFVNGEIWTTDNEQTWGN